MKVLSGNPYIKNESKKVIIDLLPIDDILKLSKTPLMIFLENKIRDNILSFKNIFGAVFEHFEGFYSFKANFLPEICKIICSEGIGAEIIGLPEFKLALKLGFPANKILVGGPCLTDDLIEESVKNKVKEIIIYNLNDLDKIHSIAKKRNVVQDVCLRINSQKYNSKLGIVLNTENLVKLKNKINDCSNIKIKTLLSHYTTQMNNSDQFKTNIKTITENLKKLSKRGINIDNINLGGGFPEATVMPQKQLKKIALEMKLSLEKHDINYKQIYFEPGRYFVGDAGLFVAKIIKVGNGRWFFLNIGNHICPKFARCSLRFYNLSQINMPHKYKVTILGIVPTDQDVLAKDYFFTEKLAEGDKVIVTNVGAYTLTFSNRFPYSLPNMFLVKDKDITQIFSPSIDHDFSIY